MKLIIAEKRSVGEAIAAAIGVKDRKNGYMEGLNAIVSWCVGHLIQLAPPSAYDERFIRWRWEDLPILPEQWMYTVRSNAKNQFETLRTLLARPDVDTVVCATDAGREGELIFRLVYEKTGCKKPVQRLWISSMEESAIRQGFQRMRPAQDYDRLYAAALCRQQADWLVGINASRMYSLLYSLTLSVGRVMTPTLAMVVERENAIARFAPETFYTVDLRCGFIASAQRMENKEEAEKIAAQCQYKTAVVTKIEKKKRTDNPPRLYDLTALQRDANRLFGYSTQQTLDYAQSLYEKRLISYPRTDSRYLTSDMEETLPSLVKAVSGAFLYLTGVSYPVRTEQVTDDEKVSDHHALIPTRDMAAAALSELPAGEKHILELLTVRLLAAVGETHEYEDTTFTVTCEGTDFTAHEQKVTKMGWKIPEALFQGSLRARGEKEKETSALRMPELREGQELRPVMAAVREGRTTPPPHYTEGTLLAAMETAGEEDMPENTERKGLGTPATRAGIIESLIKNAQLERIGSGKTKYLIPTALGKGLIAVVSDTLKSPALTAEWEQRLKAIEEGREEPDAFRQDVIALLQTLHRNVEPLPGAEKYLATEYKVIGSCPHCGRRVIETPQAKGWRCQNPRCHFMLWKENRFFARLGQNMTEEIAAELLKDRQAALKNLHSEKTGKTFDAVVALDTDETGNVRFSLRFPKKTKENRG